MCGVGGGELKLALRDTKPLLSFYSGKKHILVLSTRRSSNSFLNHYGQTLYKG